MPDKSYPDTDAYGALSNKKEVKVLSWNIWWKFEDYLNRQSLIFNELTKAKPDILCLQEVWEDKDGSQAKKIADLFGYDYYCYAKSFDFDEVSFGNAIISKYPINNYLPPGLWIIFWSGNFLLNTAVPPCVGAVTQRVWCYGRQLA